jgi:hypothetical protein
MKFASSSSQNSPQEDAAHHMKTAFTLFSSRPAAAAAISDLFIKLASPLGEDVTLPALDNLHHLCFKTSVAVFSGHPTCTLIVNSLSLQVLDVNAHGFRVLHIANVPNLENVVITTRWMDGDLANSGSLWSFLWPPVSSMQPSESFASLCNLAISIEDDILHGIIEFFFPLLKTLCFQVSGSPARVQSRVIRFLTPLLKNGRFILHDSRIVNFSESTFMDSITQILVRTTPVPFCSINFPESPWTYPNFLVPFPSLKTAVVTIHSVGPPSEMPVHWPLVESLTIVLDRGVADFLSGLCTPSLRELRLAMPGWDELFGLEGIQPNPASAANIEQMLNIEHHLLSDHFSDVPGVTIELADIVDVDMLGLSA